MIAFALALTLAAAPAPAPSAAAVDEDAWLVLHARRWMARVGMAGGEGWDGDVAAALRGAKRIDPRDPLIRELEPILRTIAREAPKGIFAADDSGAPGRAWTLAWLDVDGDGGQEIVVAGGTSPAPFFAVIQRATAGGAPGWRRLHAAPFRFLGAEPHAGHVHFFGAFDGYGVAGPALAVDRVEPAGEGSPTARRVTFELPGWDPRRLEEEANVGECATTRRTALRTEPRRDDAPREDGLGGHLPGNLLQTIEKGSTGWCLDSAKGPGGQRWTLCFFLGTSPMKSEQPERTMRTPLTSKRGPLAAGGRVLVGWVRSADLVRP